MFQLLLYFTLRVQTQTFLEGFVIFFELERMLHSQLPMKWVYFMNTNSSQAKERASGPDNHTQWN